MQKIRYLDKLVDELARGEKSDGENILGDIEAGRFEISKLTLTDMQGLSLIHI